MGVQQAQCYDCERAMLPCAAYSVRKKGSFGCRPAWYPFPVASSAADMQVSIGSGRVRLVQSVWWKPCSHVWLNGWTIMQRFARCEFFPVSSNHDATWQADTGLPVPFDFIFDQQIPLRWRFPMKSGVYNKTGILGGCGWRSEVSALFWVMNVIGFVVNGNSRRVSELHFDVVACLYHTLVARRSCPVNK